MPSPAPQLQRFSSFSLFYPFYLGEHQNRICRRLHFVGSIGVLGFLIRAWYQSDWRYLIAALFCGYGFAWIGHFAFEKNRPATFRHPIYSFIADWVMFKDILVGKIKF
jgi:hypothetical protein